MADVLNNARIGITARGALTNEFSEIMDGRINVDLNESFSFSNGTGNNQGNMIYSAERTLASAANEELDLSGVLEEAFGNAILFTKIKALILVNLDLVNSFIMGGSGSNGFISWVGDATDKVKIKPGGAIALVAPLDGYAVAAGSADKLKVEHGAEDGTTAVYRIVLIGTA